MRHMACASRKESYEQPSEKKWSQLVPNFKTQALQHYYCDVLSTFHRIVGPEILRLYWPTKTGIPEIDREEYAIF